MKTATKLIIAYGLTQEEAMAAQRSLSNTMKCAQESIIITSDPMTICTLQAEEIDIVGIKAHATDQKQWSQIMPLCRKMKDKNIKFCIIK